MSNLEFNGKSIVYVYEDQCDGRWCDAPDAPLDIPYEVVQQWHSNDNIVFADAYAKYDAEVSALHTRLHTLNKAFTRLVHSFENDCDESVCDITGLPMTRSDMEDEQYNEPSDLVINEALRESIPMEEVDKAFVSRGKSQILKDWAGKNIAAGVDIVYFDCTTQGDDDE